MNVFSSLVEIKVIWQEYNDQGVFFSGWIEPLLSRLLEEPKALLCSNVGSIDRHTFKLHHAELWQIRYIFPFLLFNLDTTSTKYKQSYVDSRVSDADPFP